MVRGRAEIPDLSEYQILSVPEILIKHCTLYNKFILRLSVFYINSMYNSYIYYIFVGSSACALYWYLCMSTRSSVDYMIVVTFGKCRNAYGIFKWPFIVYKERALWNNDPGNNTSLINYTTNVKYTRVL